MPGSTGGRLRRRPAGLRRTSICLIRTTRCNTRARTKCARWSTTARSDAARRIPRCAGSPPSSPPRKPTTSTRSTTGSRTCVALRPPGGPGPAPRATPERGGRSRRRSARAARPATFRPTISPLPFAPAVFDARAGAGSDNPVSRRTRSARLRARPPYAAERGSFERMQHCIDCGHANRPGMHFCTHCGTALVVPREGLRSPPAVVAAAVLLVGQLAFLTIRPDAPSDPVANPVANLAASAAGQAQSASSDGPGPTRAADAFASLAPAEGDSELRPATAGAGSVVQHLSERTDPVSNREPTQTDPLASHAVADASSAGADASAQRRPIADDDRDSVHAWADSAHEVQAEPPQPQTFDGAD